MAPSRPRPAFTQTTLKGGSFIQRHPSSTNAASASRDVHRISKKLPAKSKPLSKSNASGNSDRILTDVLLSIKPVHLANITNRQKNHEYRKYRLRDGIARLWLYETGEGGKGRSAITHIAVIPASVRHTPGSVPTMPFGIGNAEFNAGLKQSKYGYPILELYELVRSVTLAEMKSQWKMGGAPMGWRYVAADLWEDRWGDQMGRHEKVRRIF